ncbi:MAG: transcriptional repressor [Clostridia bacterium]|nr:transcriptional repressor [Clostridia bacterium]
MQERQTKQKSAIYEVLCLLDHPTATEVYNKVRESSPTVSRATVFRVLSGFASSGRALELKMANSDVRYDYNTAPHYHVHCVSCGKVADVCLEKTERIPEVEIVGGEGFAVEGYSVEFYGRCSKCQKERIS